MGKKIQILDYGAGNLTSVERALLEVGAETRRVSSGDDFDPEGPCVLPGVGHAAWAVEALSERGLWKALASAEGPLLGICLGFQLLAESCAEGEVRGLGFLPGRVEKLQVPLRVPHIGWNRVEAIGSDPIFQDLPAAAHFYFVHSFALRDAGDGCIGRTEYGLEFCSAARSGVKVGVQFHPEKSAEVGLRLLRNYVESV